MDDEDEQAWAELQLVLIRNMLDEAGLTHVDVVYCGQRKIRFYKRSMALDLSIDDPMVKIAHRLGWHKFE